MCACVCGKRLPFVAAQDQQRDLRRGHHGRVPDLGDGGSRRPRDRRDVHGDIPRARQASAVGPQAFGQKTLQELLGVQLLESLRLLLHRAPGLESRSDRTRAIEIESLPRADTSTPIPSPRWPMNCLSAGRCLPGLPCSARPAKLRLFFLDKHFQQDFKTKSFILTWRSRA